MPTNDASTTVWAACAAMLFSAGPAAMLQVGPGGATRSRRAGVIHQLLAARCLAEVAVVASVSARSGRSVFRSRAGRFEKDLLHLVTA